MSHNCPHCKGGLRFEVACCQGEKAVTRVLTEEEYEKVEAERREKLRIDKEIAEKKKKIQADFRKFEGRWKYWTRNILVDGDFALLFYMMFVAFAFSSAMLYTTKYYFFTFQLEVSILLACVLLLGMSIVVSLFWEAYIFVAGCVLWEKNIWQISK